MALIPNTNSFAVRALADNYFTDRINSVWGNSTTTDEIKDQALVTATSIINRLQFKGRSVNDTQGLVFPRMGSYFDRSLSRDVDFPEVNATTNPIGLPTRVVRATYELALHLVNNSALLDETNVTVGASAGSLSYQFIQKPSLLPATVRRELDDLLAGSGSRGLTRG